VVRRKLSGTDCSGLEGLCERLDNVRGSWGCLRIGAGGEGIERLTARFAGRAFSPHRHDTYAIGVTLSGVQTFRYRGEQRYCLPGQCHVLHPDETHDEGPATDEGFSYRIVYIDPSLVQQALDGKPLPFVPDPVVKSRAFLQDLLRGILDMEEPVDEVRRVDISVSVAKLLQSVSHGQETLTSPLRLSSLLRARDLIAADPTVRRSARELEAVANLDRWALARQFRAAFGTSPSRFRTMRQLDQARGMMRAGKSLAETALMAGFADQSHMTRQFRRAYGLTPAVWVAALA
jgi:AraC-like DNA-binding protein